MLSKKAESHAGAKKHIRFSHIKNPPHACVLTDTASDTTVCPDMPWRELAIDGFGLVQFAFPGHLVNICFFTSRPQNAS